MQQEKTAIYKLAPAPCVPQNPSAACIACPRPLPATYWLPSTLRGDDDAPSWPPRAAPMSSKPHQEPQRRSHPWAVLARTCPAHHLLSAMMVLLAQLACSISDESPDARACAATIHNVNTQTPRSNIAVRPLA